MGAKPIRTHVEGAPFQPGQRIRIIDAIDQATHDVSEHIGLAGLVEYLEYSCGCGQLYPESPMIGVVLSNGVREEFWPEEIAHAE